jgi:SnoaL-like polyketide cyclase
MKPTPAFHTSAAMQGFQAEFKHLDDYIRVITDRIWEGRQIETIRDYYSDPCGVITPSGASTDVQTVIDGTKSTLAQFPDRRLLAEDVIQAGDAQAGFLSSHRIISTMTHLGDGNFGQATGKKIHVRTVADCVCKDNRIVHEWLVRDQGAIAVGVGSTPEAIARQWLAARITPVLPLPQPAAPIWWRNPMSTEPLAQRYAQSIGEMLTQGSSDQALYDEAACSLGSNNSVAYGRQDISAFWADTRRVISAKCYEIESISFMPASSMLGRPPRVALRWRLQGQHTGQGKFGQATGRSLDILGINHAEFVNINGQWQVHREWVLMDEVAIWMQVLDSRALVSSTV